MLGDVTILSFKCIFLFVMCLCSAMAQESISLCESDNEKKYSDRYDVNIDNGVVIDKLTGLMWDRCFYGLTGSQCNNLLESPNELADSEANASEIYYKSAISLAADVDVANENQYLGFQDWRMPSVNELATLIDTGCVSLYQDPYVISRAIAAIQPSIIFPQFIDRQFFTRPPKMISSTPADRMFPNERLAVNFASSGNNKGDQGSIKVHDVRQEIFALKLVRTIKKSEYDVPLTIQDME